MNSGNVSLVFTWIANLNSKASVSPTQIYLRLVKTKSLVKKKANKTRRGTKKFKQVF